MGYSEKDDQIRVDIFKESGKWYTTVALTWVADADDHYLIDTFDRMLCVQLGGRFAGMWAVCLECPHAHAHPLMRKIPETA